MLATYTGIILGNFKMHYPHIHNMADAGEVLLGPIGREVLGTAQMLFLVFTMGSHILTFSQALNTISDHGTCSIVFGICGMIICFIGNMPRTLKKVSWMSIASFVSIFAAVLITMISVGIEEPDDHVDATVTTNLYHGFLAVTNIVFAYGE